MQAQIIDLAGVRQSKKKIDLEEIRLYVNSLPVSDLLAVATSAMIRALQAADGQMDCSWAAYYYYVAAYCNVRMADFANLILGS